MDTPSNTEAPGRLESVTVEAAAAATAEVVLLHGYAMNAEDLAPFARAMACPARFHFPQAPLAASARGRAWWPIDEERRLDAIAAGPRDLAQTCPPGLAPARERVARFVATLRCRRPGCPVIVGGFSQGAMLACDTLLRTRLEIAGLVLMSGSRLCFGEWQAHAARLRDLPVLLSHGRSDADLSIEAGERLRDWLMAAGARVRWIAFDGGHSVPLIVWRELKRFLAAPGS